MDLKSDTLRGSLVPARWAIALQNGFQYNRRVALKPGLYQLRVGVREPGGGERYGTAAAWVEVPDLTRKRLAMSSLFLTDAVEANLAPATDGKEQAPSPSKIVQGVRHYRAGQPVLYLFRLYHATPPEQSAMDAVMQLEILRDEKVLMQTSWQPITERQIGKDAKGYQLGGQLASARIPAWIYDLRVSVKTGKIKKPVQRTIAFGIER